MDGDTSGFFQTKIGRVVSFVIVCLALAVLAYFVIPLVARSGSEATTANERIYADASFDPPPPFKIKLHPGMQTPFLPPLPQKQTGSPAELCYWTKDGKPKTEPTA